MILRLLSIKHVDVEHWFASTVVIIFCVVLKVKKEQSVDVDMSDPISDVKPECELAVADAVIQMQESMMSQPLTIFNVFIFINLWMGLGVYFNIN